MNRFRDYILMAAGFAVLALTVGVFTAGHAIAQVVRAALVSNVDDPGRIPYQTVVDASPGRTTVSFPPVPPGKRLVVTNVSGQIDVPAGATIEPSLIALGSVAVFFPSTFQGSNHFIFGGKTQVTYDAGQTPLVLIFTESAGASGVSASLIGYLLDCSTGPCAAIAP